MKTVARFFTIAACQQATSVHMKNLLVLFCNVSGNNDYIITSLDIYGRPDLQQDQAHAPMAASRCAA
jgi:hypothetical protein